MPITPVTTLQRALRGQVRQHYPAGRIVLAIDAGAADAGPFADGLAAVFAEDDAAVFRASLADFRRPRLEREARGADSAVGRYRDTYDLSTLRRVLLDPFRLGGSTGFQLAAFDALRDAPVESDWVTAPRDAVLVVDGEFLLRPELRGAWNWSLWLQLPAEPDELAREAQALYEREAQPRIAASALVDASDPEHPTRVFGDFC